MLRLRSAACALALSLVTTLASAAEQDKKPDAKAAGAAEPSKAEPPKDKDKPFADVVKDAKAVTGLFTVYRTEDKTYLELLPEQLDHVYYVALTLESGLGERGFYAAQMGGVSPIAFHREGKSVQLVRKNLRFTADAGTPIARAVGRSFSDSVVATARLESQAHPERKSVLVDLGAFLLTDLPMLSWDLENTFRIPYRFESNGSAFGAIKGFPRNVEIETVARYAVDRPPVPPPPGGPAPAVPPPPPPRNLADVRSMTFHLRYSLAEPPAPGFRPRLADDRVGHFFDDRDDYTSDVSDTATRRFINRWRLEKQDPSAPLSPPRQPIVFWMENSIPTQYRAAIRDGVLLWNKAFEKIGFKDAVQVKQQPDDADWDPGDVRYSTIRWFITTDASFAIGPSNSDPLTGEIYDADIGFSESFTRFARQDVQEEIGPVGQGAAEPLRLFSHWGRPGRGADCTLGQEMVRDASFGLDALAATGMDRDGPEADEYVRQLIVQVAAHEVGHTLGLRHNYAASTIHTMAELLDKKTAAQGLTGSVMDYNPANVPLDRASQGVYYQTDLGPYDYWVIEYAYKPIDAASSEAELPELRRIADRSVDPLLAYATDEDAGFSPEPWDMDPRVNRFDMSRDPLEFYAHRVALSRNVFKNIETRLEKPGEGYQVLRRSFDNALGQEGFAMRLAAKYVGGVQNPRVHVGNGSGILPLQPVPKARQQAALKLVREELFSPRAFDFSPQLLNKLAPERFPNWRDFRSMQRRFDYPVHARVLNLQKGVLDRLLHPIVLGRVLDAEVKDPDPFTISMLFSGLQDSIWEETKGAGAALSINSYRRALQRDHLSRMSGMVLRTQPDLPEDARTMARLSLTGLRTQIRGALARPAVKMPVETRAHLQESLARIDEVLSAKAERAAF
jgi:uncharacterized protein DUF4953/uncharacterized protein DUF5117